MSGLDISERRIPQDGRFNVRVKNKDIDLRVSTLPTVYGVRLLDKSGGRLTEEAIGLTGPDFDKYLQMLRHRSGMVLLVGPTGSGKTTTMYAIINRLNTPEICMTTLEGPVEYNVEGVHQVQVNEKTGMTFAAGLRSILRQDPDIIAMRSAITGHRVFSTIHTNDALGTIDRLRDIGVEPYVIASALKGVISQRLVRRICPNCREAYTPTEEEASAIGLPYRRGTGCSAPATGDESASSRCWSSTANSGGTSTPRQTTTPWKPYSATNRAASSPCRRTPNGLCWKASPQAPKSCAWSTRKINVKEVRPWRSTNTQISPGRAARSPAPSRRSAKTRLCSAFTTLARSS